MLATSKPGDLKAKYGVEVFYGKGIPSLLGAGPDGTTYRSTACSARARDGCSSCCGRRAGPPGGRGVLTAVEAVRDAESGDAVMGDDRSAGDDLWEDSTTAAP